MATIIKTTFKLRRGFLEEWEEVNPILASGEPGFAIDANILKIGDGIKTWKELPIIAGTPVSLLATDDGEGNIVISIK